MQDKLSMNSQPLRASALMDVAFVRVSPDVTVEHALAAISRAGARHAIVERDGRYLGVVHERDMILAARSKKRRHRNEKLLTSLERAGLRLRKPPTVKARDEAAQAARLMLKRSCCATPVLEGERVVGLLTSWAFARLYLAESPWPEPAVSGGHEHSATAPPS